MSRNTAAKRSEVAAPDGRRVIYGDGAEVAVIERPGRDVKHFVGAEEGAKLLSGGTVTFPAGTEAPAHTHAEAEEILYVLSGSGALVCDGEPVPLKPGTYIHIPPGISHAVRCDPGEDITFFYSFSPPAVVGTW